MSVLFLLCFFLSCEQENPATKKTEDGQYSKSDYLLQLGTFEGLDEDTEWQILQAYLTKLKSGGENADLTINDVWIDQYYGTYCPSYLFPGGDLHELYDFIRTGYHDPKNQTVTVVKVCIKSTDNDTEPRDVIINIPNSTWPSVIRYYDKSSILLWDKGRLHDIEKDTDYDNTLFLVGDYRKIINRHNGLDFETDAMIREDVGKNIMTGYTAEEYATISITYLGTYNGYTALAIISGASATAIYIQIIDGVLFYFPQRPIFIRAWKEGKIYELEYLFEQGLITHEDLVEMAYFHHAGKEPIF